jgi:PIN domain nuclease of toxin-antitoxin system
VTSRDLKMVLDASAVLAWVLNEKGCHTVDKLLPFSVVPASVLTEVIYRAQERGHDMDADELYQSLLVVGIAVEPVLEEDAVRAGELIAWSKADKDALNRSLSLGDGLCIAVGERLELPLIGGDDYWSSVPSTVDYRPFR